MMSGFRENCDKFIQRCQDAIAMRDIEESRKILVEATSIFENVIPNWNGGLMSQFTSFYLDDIHMIMGKLNIFKANGYIVTPQDYKKSVYINSVINTDELIEMAIVQIFKETDDIDSDVSIVVMKLRELQKIYWVPMEFSDRWELLRPFLQWAASIDGNLAKHVLPLIIRGVKQ